jgi:cyclic beta-1,2-glucan synthetase
MSASPIMPRFAALAVVVSGRNTLGLAAPFSFSGCLLRGSGAGSALPVGARARPLDDRQRARLRRTVRKTWRYFERFVTNADGWLPPDNFQEHGQVSTLARRTSPTNIAMGLLSTLAAHDLGYISKQGSGDQA